MEKITEKLEISLVDKLKQLKSRQTELVMNIGQIHLELNQLNKLQTTLEGEYEIVNTELQKELTELEKKYPNGEIDLIDGTVIY